MSRLWDVFREVLSKSVASYQPLPSSKHTVPTELRTSQRALPPEPKVKVPPEPINRVSGTEFIRTAREEAARNAEALRRLADSEQWWTGGTDTGEEEDRGAWTR